jgi:hypothetical protein
VKYPSEYHLLPKWKQDRIDIEIARGLKDSDVYQRLKADLDVADEEGDEFQYNAILADMDILRMDEYHLVMAEIDFNDDETRYMTKGNNRVR